jgi:queuosine precursor transporter
MLKLDARFKLFLFLLGGFVTCLIVGDLIGGKLYARTVFGVEWVISVGMIPFPVTFLLTDLINEFYGHKVARTVTWVGFWMAVLTVSLLWVASIVPFAPFSAIKAEAYNNAFLGSLRIFGASLTAYIVSQYTDIGVFKLIKTVTKNRLLWLRATGSTAVSQLIDTCVIQTIAWVGTPVQAKIPSIIITSYIVKLVIAIGLTPLIYAGHALVERAFHIDPVVLGRDGTVVTPLEKQL